VTAPSATEIERAAAVLRSGGLVAFPTETVYAWAPCAQPDAVARFFVVKGARRITRDRAHSRHRSTAAWAREVPALALTLARGFWPGRSP